MILLTVTKKDSELFQFLKSPHRDFQKKAAQKLRAEVILIQLAVLDMTPLHSLAFLHK